MKVLFHAVVEYSGLEEPSGPRGRTITDDLPILETQLQEAVRAALIKTLKNDLVTLFELPVVEVTVEKMERGSLLITFGVVFLGTYEVIAKYKNFVEGIKLIAQHAQIVLRAAVAGFQPDSVTVTPAFIPPANRLGRLNEQLLSVLIVGSIFLIGLLIALAVRALVSSP